MPPPRRPGSGPRPWKLSVSAGLGLTDNAIGLAEDEFAGASPSEVSDAFTRLTATGTYSWRPGDWIVTAGYSVLSDLHLQESEADLLDQLVDVYVARNLSDDSGVGLRLRDRYTVAGGSRLRNQVRLTPSVWWSPAEWIVTELNYSIDRNDHADSPANPAQNRDSGAQSISPTVYLKWGEGRRLRLAYLQGSNNADGADFDFDERGFSVQLESEFDGELLARLFFRTTQRDYDNRNSLTGFTQKRSDDVTHIQAYLERPLHDLFDAPENMRGYLQFDLLDRGSNIGFYSYEQSSGTAGVIWDF